MSENNQTQGWRCVVCGKVMSPFMQTCVVDHSYSVSSTVSGYSYLYSNVPAAKSSTSSRLDLSKVSVTAFPEEKKPKKKIRKKKP